jgi:hypothetical protein
MIARRAWRADPRVQGFDLRRERSMVALDWHRKRDRVVPVAKPQQIIDAEVADLEQSVDAATELEGGKIAELRVFFDARPFAAMFEH